MATSTIAVQGRIAQTVAPYLYARRSGNVITLNGYITFDATTEAYTIPTPLNEAFRPTEVVRGMCNLGANAYTMGMVGQCIISNSSGNITLRPKDSSTSFTSATISLAWTV